MEANERKRKSGNTALKVVAGVLVGAAVGVIAGILLAPDSGKNTRKKIVDKTKDMADDVKMKATDTLKNITNKIARETAVEHN